MGSSVFAGFWSGRTIPHFFSRGLAPRDSPHRLVGISDAKPGKYITSSQAVKNKHGPMTVVHAIWALDVRNLRLHPGCVSATELGRQTKELQCRARTLALRPCLATTARQARCHPCYCSFVCPTSTQPFTMRLRMDASIGQRLCLQTLLANSVTSLSGRALAVSVCNWRLRFGCCNLWGFHEMRDRPRKCCCSHLILQHF